MEVSVTESFESESERERERGRKICLPIITFWSLDCKLEKAREKIG